MRVIDPWIDVEFKLKCRFVNIRIFDFNKAGVIFKVLYCRLIQRVESKSDKNGNVGCTCLALSSFKWFDNNDRRWINDWTGTYVLTFDNCRENHCFISGFDNIVWKNSLTTDFLNWWKLRCNGMFRISV
jgi:hypothetical protein